MNRREQDWELTPRKAIARQSELRSQVRSEPLDVGSLRTVAGCDLSSNRGRPEVWAGLVVLEAATFEVVDEAVVATTMTFPYVPGLLSFRELPPLLAAYERLTVAPDAILCDGHGYAHPRRLGLASHAGLLFDRPTVGCAKSRLIGEFDEPGTSRGSCSDLLDEGELIGQVVRTRDGVKPLFVSLGHRCRLQDAVELVLRCGRRHRLPEPTRLAHQLVNRARRGESPRCVTV